MTPIPKVSLAFLADSTEIEEEIRGIQLDRKLAHEREEYRDLLSELECVTRLLVDELGDTLEAHDSVGQVFPEYWLESLRRLGKAIEHSPP